MGPCPEFGRPPSPARGSSYTLAQKIVGRACGVEGVTPGTYCEPTVSSVGSQDTTGPMNRNELEELGCLGFGADLVLQSFCHTVGLPEGRRHRHSADTPPVHDRPGRRRPPARGRHHP